MNDISRLGWIAIITEPRLLAKSLILNNACLLLSGLRPLHLLLLLISICLSHMLEFICVNGKYVLSYTGVATLERSHWRFRVSFTHTTAYILF